MRAWRSFDEWRGQRLQVWSDDADRPCEPEALRLAGTCGACGAAAGFEHGVASRDPREGLRCLGCGCNARQRAAAGLLLSTLARAGEARVYVTEQASPLFLALRRVVGRVTGSEYPQGGWRWLRLSAWLWRRGVPAWVDRQDVTALAFGGNRFDAVVSLDVLEHVPDYRTALCEFARVLKPGGSLVLTVPFHDRAEATTTIARLRADGSVEFDGEPEFHGDPLGGGVPCFHHFGWDLLDELRDSGFVAAVACLVQDRARGLPEGVWVVQATR